MATLEVLHRAKIVALAPTSIHDTTCAPNVPQAHFRCHRRRHQSKLVYRAPQERPLRQLGRAFAQSALQALTRTLHLPIAGNAQLAASVIQQVPHCARSARRAHIHFLLGPLPALRAILVVGPRLMQLSAPIAYLARTITCQDLHR
jgi:hypothetical protein